MKTVVVTGITGYIGAHTAIQLLEQGYHVIGTMRDLGRESHIRTLIASHTERAAHLSFRQADLTDDVATWSAALREADAVIHVASPLPRVMPTDPDELIVPAKQGVLSVLQAASAAGAKRVVLTSSTVAIMYGVAKKKTFTEHDWTDPDNRLDTTPYIRSKTIAERAAWEFMKTERNGLELVVINPGLVLGPVLDPNDYGTSAALVLKMLDGSLPALPRTGYSLVDVRSVADMHVRALETPEAAGERFICANTYMTLREIADVLRRHYPHRRLPKATLPNWTVRLLARFDRETAPIAVELNAERKHDNQKAKKLLGWNPIADQQSIVDTADSLIYHQFVNLINCSESIVSSWFSFCSECLSLFAREFSDV